MHETQAAYAAWKTASCVVGSLTHSAHANRQELLFHARKGFFHFICSENLEAECERAAQNCENRNYILLYAGSETFAVPL